MQQRLRRSVSAVALMLVADCSAESRHAIDRSKVEAYYQAAIRCTVLFRDLREGLLKSNKDAASRLDQPITIAKGKASAARALLGLPARGIDADLDSVSEDPSVKSAAFDLLNARGPAEERKTTDKFCGPLDVN